MLDGGGNKLGGDWNGRRVGVKCGSKTAKSDTHSKIRDAQMQNIGEELIIAQYSPNDIYNMDETGEEMKWNIYFYYTTPTQFFIPYCANHADTHCQKLARTLPDPKKNREE